MTADPVFAGIYNLDTNHYKTNGKGLIAVTNGGGLGYRRATDTDNLVFIGNTFGLAVITLGDGAGANDVSLIRASAHKLSVAATSGTTFDGAIVSTSASAGHGYATGAGGAVTQATNKSTGVTLNKVCGTITMNNAALPSAISVGFTLTNSAIAATDVVAICIKSGATAASYLVGVDAVAAGSATVHLRNTSGGSLSEAIVLSFAVIKAVAA